MRRDSIIALLMVCTFTTIQAQNETQALRYSMHNPFGTARYAAQGGAIAALGSDFSAVQANPAGLGFYRSSEFSFTPSLYWVNTSSDYMGNMAEDSRLKFNVGSLGYVSAINRNQKSGFVGASFAMGYNTLVNFNNRTTIRGSQATSTMLDDFTWHANSAPDFADPDNLNQFYEQVVYDANLLPWVDSAGEYRNVIESGGYGQGQYRLLDQSGYIGEYTISGAFNFSNFLYFGATMGIQSVRFNEEIYHVETDPNDLLSDFNSFRFREFNTTKGWGYNMKFGMIIRPFQLLRVGASFQIPTYYYLTEEKLTDVSSTWDASSGISSGSASSPIGIYDYRLKSPMKVNAHASVILFKMATVSAAYEYTDYSSARLEANDDKFLVENDQIRRSLKAVHNLKAGAELRISSVYFRGGIQYLASPYTDTRNNAEEFIYSGGLGIRSGGVFFDMSYSYGHTNEVYGLYSPTPGINEVSLNKVNRNNLMLTLGLKF
ncbi:MAG: hypothetical protein GY790_14735 [Bacteroidetes bacterium]|nr:hypothetical protein [Bacteroidota bacterium]